MQVQRLEVLIVEALGASPGGVVAQPLHPCPAQEATQDTPTAHAAADLPMDDLALGNCTI